MLLSFDLSDSDLDRLHAILQSASARALDLTRDEILVNAQNRLMQVKGSDAPDFICVPMAQIEFLISMLTDEDWGLVQDDARRVLAALAYFSEPEDLIPDGTPTFGYLDDAIMVEIVCKELEHEIQAYHDFVAYRSAGSGHRDANSVPLQRADWLEERRQQLHARMRRMRENASGKESKSPFSLL